MAGHEKIPWQYIQMLRYKTHNVGQGTTVDRPREETQFRLLG